MWVWFENAVNGHTLISKRLLGIKEAMQLERIIYPSTIHKISLLCLLLCSYLFKDTVGGRDLAEQLSSLIC